MKAAKLPRKLKASLKKSEIKKTDNPEWNTKDIIIYGYSKHKRKITSLQMRDRLATCKY